MFFTGTVGIIIGGPIAILLISMVSPETVGGAGIDAVWRGLSTLAGSWIGGGANQTAMLEIYQYNPTKIWSNGLCRYRDCKYLDGDLIDRNREKRPD